MSKPMTPEEFQAKLEEKGFGSGKWVAQPAMSGRPPVINNQIETLQTLRKALKQQESRALQELKRAREELTRLRQGGGS